MKKTALVAIADGIEELEAVALIDLLRRADAEVTVASVDGLQVVASRKTKLTADCGIEDCANAVFDLIALPGGLPGAEHLRDSPTLVRLLKEQAAAGRLYAAICASPIVVLKAHGLLPKRAACHSYFRKELTEPTAAEDDVVTDGNCTTSCGPGTAFAFALALAEQLCGADAVQRVRATLR